MSHDINGDPEMWELREQYGDRAALVWLECLSIADRNSGIVGPDSPQLYAVLASKCRIYSPKVRSILIWCLGRGWLEVRDIFTPLFGPSSSDIRKYLVVAKWAKYNKTRVSDKSLSETRLDETRHDITSTKKARAPKAAVTVDLNSSKEWPSPEKLVELYNSLTPDECPAVETLSPARRQKAKQYLETFPDEQFWVQVFDRVHHSRFLRGAQNKNGHGSFRFDFDWMLTKGKDGSENVVKVAEGRYADER